LWFLVVMHERRHADTDVHMPGRSADMVSGHTEEHAKSGDHAVRHPGKCADVRLLTTRQAFPGRWSPRGWALASSTSCAGATRSSVRWVAVVRASRTAAQGYLPAHPLMESEALSARTAGPWTFMTGEPRWPRDDVS
jgi:hypothetical protein